MNFKEISFYITIFFACWILAYWIGQKFNLKNRGLEIKPLYLAYRTTRVNQLLDYLAGKLSRILPVLNNISVVFSVGLMAFGAHLLINNIFSFFVNVEQAAPIFPAVPFITIRSSLPYFLISIAVIIVVHEFAHGIVARFEKISIKSAGVLFIAVIPGGFVEPDEESFKKADIRKKLNVLAAGSSSNLIFALIMMILLVGLFHPSGVMINGLTQNSPAGDVGLRVGDVIKAVDDVKISNVNEFKELMANIKVGDSLSLYVMLANNTYKNVYVTAVGAPDNASRAIIGIYPVEYIKNPQAFLTVYWIQTWSLSVAIFNMLPIYPLDGGSFVSHLLEKYVKKHAKLLKIVITLFFLMLLASNIALTFKIFGFVSI